MSRFKVGDLVTPVNVDRYTDRNSDRRKEMLGRTLVVRSVHNDEFTSVVFAGFPGKGVWQWRPDDLRLVSEAQMPERSKLLTVNLDGHGFLNPYADTSPTEPTDPAPAAVAEGPEPADQPELTAAEVVLPPLTGLQQRILTLLGQHRGLTAQRIADDLHAPLEGVQDALNDLSHLVTSRPLALPEIQVWEVV